MKTISFDFDDTICLWPECMPNKPIIDLIHKHKEAGDKVILVTSRFDVTKTALLRAFKEWNIPIAEEDMHFTNQYSKRWIFRNLDADAHYDDDDEQLAELAHYYNMDVFWVRRDKIINFRERNKEFYSPIFNQ